MSTAVKPTRREERRLQTVQEIKHLAMQQISEGGPDAVSLSGIVREMSMSPAAVYRYFASRDALLADLVVDAYNDLADHLASLGAVNISRRAYVSLLSGALGGAGDGAGGASGGGAAASEGSVAVVAAGSSRSSPPDLLALDRLLEATGAAGSATAEGYVIAQLLGQTS